MLEMWKGVVTVDLILTIGRLLYDAAHLTAILLTVFLMAPVEAVRSLEAGAWGLSALWLALLLLDRTGRLELHGSFGKIVASLLLPAALGSGELLFRDDGLGEVLFLRPEISVCFLLFVLLLGSILLRKPGGEAGGELLLERGFELAISEVIWLHLLGGAVFLMATFGLLLVVIIGELMAQNSSLLDYGGLAGVLLGLLGIHLAQVVLFWRGLRLARGEDPDLGGPWSPLLLWIPVANLVWAGRLRHQLWNRRMKRGSSGWAEW